ncbi:hypothetical protein KC726_06015 [Candidatus Woesebacteria bacterium]|nr:hypothetical protein [Candidatus Woesebacteria bacterium]
MLTVICGEDSAAARDALNAIKTRLKEQSFTIEDVGLSDIERLTHQDVVSNLFGQQAVYVIDGLSKKYKGREKTPFKEAVQTIAKRKDITLIDWEDGISAYRISPLKRIATTFNEYKPKKSIFQLLESAYPNNKRTFISTLREVAKTHDDFFIYTMLWKHIRTLIQLTVDPTTLKLAPWQKSKLSMQAKQWKEKRLTLYYYGLTKIDASMKTSAQSFSIIDSLELLACYYL